ADFTRACRGGDSGLLRGKRRSFSGTLEAQRAGARPAHDVAFQIRYGHGRVVERGLDVGDTRRNNPLFLLLCTLLLGLTCHLNSPVYVFAEAFLRTAIAPRRGP